MSRSFVSISASLLEQVCPSPFFPLKRQSHPGRQ